ncbi:sugar ABC transporter substrate-binding protein, partial [Miniimonas arenae]
IQYSTVAKPTSDLVGKTMEIITSLQQGDGFPEATEQVDNGVKDVDVYLLDPVVVTKANIKEVFANDPSRLALLN